MKNFEEYLQKEGLKPVTVYQYRKYAGYFMAWATEKGLESDQVSYTEVLDYADELKRQEHRIGYINRVLLSVRYYFSWLQKEGRATRNPAGGIILKGTIRTIPRDLLNKEELISLYECYPVTDARSQRNKVILSLMVYQGITVDDLHHLKPEDVKLKEGKIHLPSGGLIQGRILKLEASQVMELHEYLHITRPEILAERTVGKSGRKPDHMIPSNQIHQLIISMNGCSNIKNSLLHMGYNLRKLNPKYKNTGQIRQSVITEWLKEKDLRLVQYMAGHRNVSSTERYKTSNLEDLKDALQKFHPLRS